MTAPITVEYSIACVNCKIQIDKVLRLIDDDELAKVDLQHQLDKLKKYSQDCVRDSAQVRDKFANWQDYARQIRRACTAADGMILP